MNSRFTYQQFSYQQSINQQARMIEISFSKQTLWQRSIYNIFDFAFVIIFSQTYHDSNEKEQDQKYYQQKTYYDKKISKSKNELLQSFESCNVIINVYFNEHDEFKYNLTLYICEHCFTMQIFDNNDEFREHVLHYHDFDTRFIDIKSKL